MVQILEFEREIFALETQIRDLVSMSHMYDSVLATSRMRSQSSKKSCAD